MSSPYHILIRRGLPGPPHLSLPSAQHMAVDLPTWWQNSLFGLKRQDTCSSATKHTWWFHITRHHETL